MLSTLALRPTMDSFRELGPLLHGFLQRPWLPTADTAVGFPAMNVWETEEGYVLETELPGMNLEDVDVTILDSTITISGTHREQEAEGVSYRRRERRSGSFSRELRLPARIDANGISATLTDGVLRVNVPKAEEALPRKIEVRVR